MIGALGAIPYGGVGIQEVIFLQRPSPIIEVNESRTHVTVVMGVVPCPYEIKRSDGPYKDYQIIYQGSESVVIDEVPDPDINYSYIVRWVADSPFIPTMSLDTFIVQPFNIL